MLSVRLWDQFLVTWPSQQSKTTCRRTCTHRTEPDAEITVETAIRGLSEF